MVPFVAHWMKTVDLQRWQTEDMPDVPKRREKAERFSYFKLCQEDMHVAWANSDTRHQLRLQSAPNNKTWTGKKAGKAGLKALSTYQFQPCKRFLRYHQQLYFLQRPKTKAFLSGYTAEWVRLTALLWDSLMEKQFLHHCVIRKGHYYNSSKERKKLQGRVILIAKWARTEAWSQF